MVFKNPFPYPLQGNILELEQGSQRFSLRTSGVLGGIGAVSSAPSGQLPSSAHHTGPRSSQLSLNMISQHREPGMASEKLDLGLSRRNEGNEPRYVFTPF